MQIFRQLFFQKNEISGRKKARKPVDFRAPPMYAIAVRRRNYYCILSANSSISIANVYKALRRIFCSSGVNEAGMPFFIL